MSITILFQPPAEPARGGAWQGAVQSSPGAQAWLSHACTP